MGKNTLFGCLFFTLYCTSLHISSRTFTVRAHKKQPRIRGCFFCRKLPSFCPGLQYVYRIRVELKGTGLTDLKDIFVLGIMFLKLNKSAAHPYMVVLVGAHEA